MEFHKFLIISSQLCRKAERVGKFRKGGSSRFGEKWAGLAGVRTCGVSGGTGRSGSLSEAAGGIGGDGHGGGGGGGAGGGFCGWRGNWLRRLGGGAGGCRRRRSDRRVPWRRRGSSLCRYLRRAGWLVHSSRRCN